MTTNYERAMEAFEATLTPEERALGSAIAADFDFAREVVILRTALGISQSELAARTGVPQPELSRIEHGKAIPSIARGQRILGGLGAQFGIRRSGAVGYVAADARPAAKHSNQPR
jgi:transcriptional regulator with XRE-family HTH domain